MQLHLGSGRLNIMTAWPFRVTPPLVDVVDALTRAEGKLHGWALADLCGQTPPNVYRALERLRAAGWVEFEWESENPELGRPRRRLYWLTAEGWRQGPALLAERRGEARRSVPLWAARLISGCSGGAR
jgi:DNA-binding MarR family transcriptional regulator